MKATRNDRRSFQPISEFHETIDVHWDFSPEEFNYIEMGRVPLEMGDQYFIFMEDDCLYISQWTGQCLYMLWFRQEGTGYLAYRLRISRNPPNAQIQNNRDHARIVVSILKDSLRVDHSRTFPY